MKLKATRQEYEFKDRSGYRFTVIAEETPGRGWSATVTMRAHGLVSTDAALDALRPPVEQFLRQLTAHTSPSPATPAPPRHPSPRRRHREHTT